MFRLFHTIFRLKIQFLKRKYFFKLFMISIFRFINIKKVDLETAGVKSVANSYQTFQNWVLLIYNNFPLVQHLSLSSWPSILHMKALQQKWKVEKFFDSKICGKNENKIMEVLIIFRVVSFRGMNELLLILLRFFLCNLLLAAIILYIYLIFMFHEETSGNLQLVLLLMNKIRWGLKGKRCRFCDLNIKKKFNY